MMAGFAKLNSRPDWTPCRACGAPNTRAADICRDCYSWIKHGHAPAPPVPTRYELERMIVRLARRVAALESDTDYGGSGWQREFYQWSERVALLEARA